MRAPSILAVALLALLAGPRAAAARPQDDAFARATASVQEDLRASLEELARLREQLAAEKIPLARELAQLERELTESRAEFQAASRLLDSRSVDLSTLGVEIVKAADDENYVSGLLVDYIRNFEAGLHISELARYEAPLEAAKLAPENSGLAPLDVFRAQVDLLAVSLDRIEELLGGALFEGTAVDTTGLVRRGTFALLGPAALFLSEDGEVVGTAEQRLGSLEPTVIAFAKPEQAEAARAFVERGSGAFPVDTTLGNAHKIAATEETFLEHVSKGGALMYPIFAMASAALLVALGKWTSFLFLRQPKRKRVAALLEAVGRGDEAAARDLATGLPGPVGRMLQVGVDNLRQPRELIEEVMYETVLTTKLRLQSFLPFIAICASSAPLLGLLGTVTGIINTFKSITAFGSGDVKMLSGGISEALITTEYGLIVAIPSLLLHAFLSRKARGIVSKMETTAIAFANEVGKAEAARPVSQREVIVPAARGPEADMVREQIREVLGELLEPLAGDAGGRGGAQAAAAR